MKPGSPEWLEHVQQLATKEHATPLRWFYLSFADEVFHGAVVLQAHGITTAITAAHLLGINPGGEVAGWELDEKILATIPEDSRYRLLSREDIQAFWPDAKSFREMEAEG